MELNDITYLIRGAAFRVYNNLGPGLLETIYQKALIKELTEVGLKVQSEVEVDVIYEKENLGIGLRLDLLVENEIIIELKSVKQLENIHHLQLLTYLKVAKKKIGLLINFNEENFKNGIHRKVN